jgi:TolB protein
MLQMRRSLALLVGLLLPTALLAQDPEEGVRLGLVYQAEYQPGFVILPFAADRGAEQATALALQIVRQDLEFSNRFDLRHGTAPTRPGEAVNTALWKERGADWVLVGGVQPARGGFALRLVLHDAVYGQVKGDHTFTLPPLGAQDFRMAVHVAADEVVRWVFGTPGMAATRIAFVMDGRGSKEMYVVDSDGENLQRITNDGSIALSPAWSPDRARLVYTSFRGGSPAIYERELATGRDRLISGRDGINITPSYSPDGRTVVFATTMGGNTEVVSFDRERMCCLTQLTRGRRTDSLSPSFSPDGRRLAFVSDRLGEPHIYVMPASGGEPRMVSEYVHGRRGYNTGVEWSPRGPLLAFSTRAGGSLQLAVVNVDGGGMRLLTNEGRNEDPSWAPDGRHVVFSSPDREGGGLFVLDTVSGHIRPLLRGRGYGLPAWSPSFAPDHRD